MQRHGWAAVAALVFAAGLATADDPIRVPRANSDVFERDSHADRALPIAPPEYLADSVVKIAAKRADGWHAGSGVIVCQDRRRLYVLTAKHVLSGTNELDPELDNRPLFGVKKLEVSFRGGSPKAIRRQPEDFRPIWADHLDLALITVDLRQERGMAVANTLRSEVRETGARVRTIGHSLSTDAAWLPQDGRIRTVAEYVVFHPALDAGYSGGPLFDEHGRVIGINKDTLEGRFTRATPIELALDFARSRLPRKCR